LNLETIAHIGLKREKTKLIFNILMLATNENEFIHIKFINIKTI